MKNLKRIFVFVLFAFAAVLAFGAINVKAADVWTKVTSSSEALEEGDEIIIVAADANYALSTNQKSNNRGQANVTKSGDTVSFGNDVQVLTLVGGTVADTFAFNTGSGYLYAAGGTSSNHLKTQNSIDQNASFSIVIDEDGIASIKAQNGSDANLRNILRYNSSSSLFACYKSGQGDVVIYRKAVVQGVPQLDTPTATMNNKEVSWGAVANAVSYKIGIFSSIDGTSTNEVFATEATSYDLSNYTPQGTWYVKVQALGDGNTALNSDWSESAGTIVNGSDPIQMTVTELLAATLYNNTTTVEVTGTVTGYYQDGNVAGYNEQYGNVSLYITDGVSTITAYRAKSTDNPEYAKNVQAGDFVKIVGALAEYQSVKQIGANCQITEFKPQCAVGVQTADAGNGAQHVRLVGGLNVNYEDVTALTFTITDANDAQKTTTITVSNVFGTLTANGTAGVAEITAASQGFESLFALTITNIPAGTTLKVTATYTTAEGTYTSAVKTVEVPAAQ